ncbi:LOW QUALITY PROTEIN: hypothetical protein KUTeg_018456 [Tegillarca granosa]|uniref:Uncharacterized protein n=1 Tax=Tegillarca granosa TaxID=220873 RepID=A0ABQ9ENP7_TEGGR|nr:LOW QUALITY PROTEIN: hypothetical protein KUTeg_018456 [Tegillarca granosa]
MSDKEENSAIVYFQQRSEGKILTASEELDKCPPNIEKAKCALEEVSNLPRVVNPLTVSIDAKVLPFDASCTGCGGFVVNFDDVPVFKSFAREESIRVSVLCISRSETFIFSKGIWKFNVKDAYLKELANKLPSSRQDNTIRQYIYGFQKLKKWTDMFQETCALPAQPLHASLYLLGIMQSSNTCSPVNSAFYGIHGLTSYVDPILDVLPKSVKEAASRILGHGTNRKQTVNPLMLQQLIDHFSINNLSNLSLKTMCLIAFSGFFRFAELCCIIAYDIVFEPSYVKIFVKKSKNDVYRDGNSPCSNSALLLCIQAANISTSSDEFVFRQLTYFKSSDSYFLKGSSKFLILDAERLC